MARKRIAPTLRMAVDTAASGLYRDADRELRALLAVARAAQRAGPYVSTTDDLAMDRALRCLERVSGGKP